jgi:hypothetical protein
MSRLRAWWDGLLRGRRPKESPEPERSPEQEHEGEQPTQEHDERLDESGESETGETGRYQGNGH